VLSPGLIFFVAALYLGGLFVLAFVTDHRAQRGGSRFIGSPVVYTLSLAVYCTSWTFFGAVGSATRNGLEFLTIYLGPTIMLMGWWFLLRKLVRISKAQKITSIADFLSARYGKSEGLSALVTVMALLGVTPYIALQLKAVAAGFDALGGAGAETGSPLLTGEGLFADTGFWVAVCMATFVILFGTRNLGADERHPGVVAAIAFESIVKLFSLAAVAAFATYGLHDGVQDLFAGANSQEAVRRLFGFQDGFEARWVATLFLAAAAIVCLPRQFQVAVVENSDERHLATASWLFPLYMLLISMCVIPIAISGMTLLPASANPDLYVLDVPLSSGQGGLALFAFIGGLSAATSMVIVASIALSIMISNHLVTPVLLRLPFFTDPEVRDFSKTLLRVRRLSIVAILSLGFAYYDHTGTTRPLASIGLISFAGAAQFLPLLIGAVYWKGGTRLGAMAGLIAGFLLWAYLLVIPSFASVSDVFVDLVEQGPFGIAFLKPDALFGFTGWDHLVHGLLWSLTANVLCFVVVSLATNQSALERLQGAIFVDAFDTRRSGVQGAIQRSATTGDLFQLTQHILGYQRAERIFREYALSQGRGHKMPSPNPALIAYIERQLANSVGAATARTLVSRVVKGETMNVETVIELLDETQEAIRYSRELERKSRELEDTAAQLRLANEQLTRLDKLKDEFLSQISHELRTPMTSIRLFSEILMSPDELDEEQIRRFIGIIQHESDRLTRLLDDMLDLGRMEAGQVDWEIGPVDARAAAAEAVTTMTGLAQSRGAEIVNLLDDEPMMVDANRDRLTQVLINLLSNAIKFNDQTSPTAWIEPGDSGAGYLEIRVRDNGPGIPKEDLPNLFSKFARGWNERSRHGTGSGLGLAISNQIMDHLGGKLVLLAAGPKDGGTCFAVRLRRHEAADPEAVAPDRGAVAGE